MNAQEMHAHMIELFVGMIDKRISRVAGDTEFAEGWRNALLDLRSVFADDEFSALAKKMVDEVNAEIEQKERTQ